MDLQNWFNRLYIRGSIFRFLARQIYDLLRLYWQALVNAFCCLGQLLVKLLLVFMVIVFALLWLLALRNALGVLGGGIWFSLANFISGLSPEFMSRLIPSVSPSVGTGAMIVALLGAPILLWSTYLKTKTLHYQKEGHITERISKAVEQLGAEKTVKRQGEAEETTEPNIEVRIGGLLSLERIAQDSTTHDKGRDHVRIMEILCAYVRENAPARSVKKSPLDEWGEVFNKYRLALMHVKGIGDRDAMAAEQAFDESGKTYGHVLMEMKVWIKDQGPPRQDIQQALYIIGRRNAKQRGYEAQWNSETLVDAEKVFDVRPTPRLIWHGDEASFRIDITDFKRRIDIWKDGVGRYRGYRIDLSSANLTNANLSGSVFAGANLQGAQMQGANLQDTQVHGANLRDAQMQMANLKDAQMQGASLANAQMQKANLARAHVRGADFHNAQMQGVGFLEAQMQGASFFEAQMQGVDLCNAQMQGANLQNAQMQMANLQNAQMQMANLQDAQMRGAGFRYAQMQGAALRYTQMQGADLEDAQMQGAVLKDVNISSWSLQPEQLASMFGDGSVILSDEQAGHRPSHWPEAMLDFYGFRQEHKKWLSDPDNYQPPPPRGDKPKA